MPNQGMWFNVRKYFLPADITAAFKKGISSFHQKQWDTAAESFLEVVRRRPDHLEGWYNLGLVYVQQNNLPAARECFQAVLRLKSGHANSHYYLGKIAHQAGDCPEALFHLKNAILLKKKFASAHNLIGIIYRDQKNYLLALEHFETAFRQDPDLWTACFNAGLTCENLQHDEKAAAYYRQTINRHPAFTEAHIQLALLLRRLKKYKEETDVWKNLLALFPDDVSVQKEYRDALKRSKLS